MSRYARKIDSNQVELVKALRSIPGVSVKTGMDDLLLGYRGRTFWIEVKNPDTVSIKTGKVQPSKLKKSQIDLRLNWNGHYAVVWTLEQILTEIGIK